MVGRSTYSEGLKESEERVGCSVSAGFGAEWCGLGDCLLFERGVGVLVDVGGLGALMLDMRVIWRRLCQGSGCGLRRSGVSARGGYAVGA